MILLGLTGSIGMGKSTVAKMFRQNGVPVFDADATVHRLQRVGGALVGAIEALFPGTTSSAQGVDRGALGRAVLGNAEALRSLEALVHPAVLRERITFLRRYRSRPIIVLDIPLLFEKGGAKTVDAVVVVSAAGWMQRRRVLARSGMSAQRLNHILKLQLRDREKRRRADFVIETGVPRERTRRQVERLVACLRSHGVGYCRRCAKSSSTPKRRG